MNTGGENSAIQRESDDSTPPTVGSDASATEGDSNKRASADEPTRGAKIRRALIEVSVALLVIVGIRTLQSRSHASGQAPIVRAIALDGRAITLGSREGPRVLWFFATWCSVCRASDHNVRRFAGDPSVVLVASDSGDDARVRAFVLAQGLAQNIVVNDQDGSIARRYGVRSFPTTFAVDRQGHIRGTDVGYTTELGLRARRWWASVR